MRIIAPHVGGGFGSKLLHANTILAGDDGPATDAQLNSPFGVAVTADGGFLIADTMNQVVRKVSADGVITRAAGTTGTAGSAGDDGPATDAQVNYPLGTALTADGGFVIADINNLVVRKVKPIV